jgi:hypothetical protein
MDDKQISISEDNVDDFQIFCFISQGNPGAISILMNMIKNIDHNKLSIFLHLFSFTVLRRNADFYIIWIYVYAKNNNFICHNYNSRLYFI